MSNDNLMKHAPAGRAMRVLIEELFVRGAPDGLPEGSVGLAAMG